MLSVSSFVFFLHPLDSVFYSGMLLVGGQNYFWMLLMMEPKERLATWIHPFVHGELGKGEEEPSETSKILKSHQLENEV